MAMIAMTTSNSISVNADLDGWRKKGFRGNPQVFMLIQTFSFKPALENRTGKVNAPTWRPVWSFFLVMLNLNALSSLVSMNVSSMFAIFL